jgi:hypothetical protein
MAIFIAVWPFVTVGVPLNDRFLPGFFAPRSLAANAALLVVCATFAALAHAHLAAARGVGLALRFANVVLWLSLFLTAATYLHTYHSVAAADLGAVLPRFLGMLVCSVLAWLLFARALEGRRAAAVL